MHKKQWLQYLGINGLKRSDLIFTLLCLLASLGLGCLPTGFEQAATGNGHPVKAIVRQVDNGNRHVIGITNTGEQELEIEILTGQYRGQQFTAVNHFLGKLDLDKVYAAGDKVFTVLSLNNQNKIHHVQVIDHYRLQVEWILVIIFMILLLLYGGWVGFKALITFFFSILIIWKLLIPGLLRYLDPLLLALGIILLLTGIIIFLVAGFTKKGLVAFLGAVSGIALTCLLSVVFGSFFKIPGAIKPFSEILLHTGYLQLNLSRILLAGIFLASSGAVMDIAMDISASLEELTSKRPDLHTGEIVFSGFTIGRAVIGTMTTTLLLAYSGGFSSLLMVFTAQGIPLTNILNIQYVAAEILHTLIGSFGLVAVAPLTALFGGLIYTKKTQRSAVQTRI